MDFLGWILFLGGLGLLVLVGVIGPSLLRGVPFVREMLGGNGWGVLFALADEFALLHMRE